jgi:hypothetical protein
MAAQVGYVGLGQVAADGVVHRGLLGVTWWALFPRIRLIDTSPSCVASPACGSPCESIAPWCQ